MEAAIMTYVTENLTIPAKQAMRQLCVIGPDLSAVKASWAQEFVSARASCRCFKQFVNFHMNIHHKR